MTSLEIKPDLKKGYDPCEYFTDFVEKVPNTRIELVTVGATVGATVPATLGQTFCNALIDTGATRSCLSEEYYQQLLLPRLKPTHRLLVQTASGGNLQTKGTVKCDFKLQKEAVLL